MLEGGRYIISEHIRGADDITCSLDIRRGEDIPKHVGIHRNTPEFIGRAHDQVVEFSYLEKDPC